jgi:hypothetical protein
LMKSLILSRACSISRSETIELAPFDTILRIKDA